MTRERRRKRSSFAGLALQYLFNSIVARKGIEAIVLADTSGLVVASSHKETEAEEVAALAPLMARSAGLQYDWYWGAPLTMQQVDIGRDTFYLCALGENGPALKGAQEAAGGVDRILAA